MRQLLLLSVWVSLMGSGGSSVYALPPAKLENLPPGVEVHSVGIYEPRHRGLEAAEITDYRALVTALRGKDQPGAHLRKLIRTGPVDVLTEAVEMGIVEGAQDARQAEQRVTWHLSRNIGQAARGKVFYDKEAFAKLELPKSVREMIELADRRTPFQTERLNRDLLALAFPKCIAPTPTDFQTADIVIKPGRPVVLVTSSYSQCRWNVTVEKGAKLLGVIQFGGGAQAVSGTDAPIVYRAAILPDGKRATTSSANVWKEEDTPAFKAFRSEIKAISGQDYTSHQGMYQADGTPFIVKPSAK